MRLANLEIFSLSAKSWTGARVGTTSRASMAPQLQQTQLGYFIHPSSYLFIFLEPIGERMKTQRLLEVSSTNSMFLEENL